MTPETFEKCIRAGGRVRRKSIKGGKYINICFKDGKSYPGHVHKGKKKN